VEPTEADPGDGVQPHQPQLLPALVVAVHLPSISPSTAKLTGAECLVVEKTVRLRVAWDRENVAGGIANTSGIGLHIWLHNRVPSCAIQPEQHDIS
jgi:hypothetical protein